ncbi:MAG: sigma 54-interacting transcriptional regulator [Deltaproteobacteria bacterium]|nr:sigma 54-interacting transcriptional regulator [Deltaproteobacteria bacterium]
MNSIEGEDDHKYSNMGMALSLDGQTLGMINFQAGGWNQYTEYHAHLLSLVQEPLSLAMSNTLKCQELAKIKGMLSEMKNELLPDPASAGRVNIIGKSFGLKAVMEMADMVSRSDSPVLLMGETGVGKDVIANAIHYASNRRAGPFIKVNCGAIPENLIDSELFGHEKGAFTGAVGKKQGRFERANGGTILLDEIGELPPQAQVRLLRVLQHMEIERVGGTRVIPVDVRIISASNRNLEEMVRENRFREDLWFRLNVFPIMIPPLRRRTEDIPSFVHYLLEEKSKELKLSGSPDLAPGALERLKAYPWPGNVRELENVIERELILSQTTTPARALTFQHMHFIPTEHEKTVPGSRNTDLLRLDEVLTEHFRHVLELTNGKIYGPDGAADLLGIHPDTFRHKLRKLGIPFGREDRKRL